MSDMNFNYNYVGSFDISSIKNKLNDFDDAIWSNNTYRQREFSPHVHTETVELMWDFESLQTNDKGKIHKNFYELNIDLLLNNLKPIYEKKYGKGDFMRVILVKLKKESNIKPHIDYGKSLVLCKRTHIAIITNPLVSFVVGGEKKYMEAGDIWEINNQKIHSVENTSKEDRIHFIIDYLISNEK